ncbi:MAG: exodeoxyribonuclease VII small subunit [Clostridiales bacterium]|jgi:exodeoxyribonuclease VII small subunit|nr:exodeoxyribonuclease VII small subunit [Clostridiales bacterium]HOC09649.1 exodeoxyribonuclease VII small subunit [Bacillota bacterium]HQA49011.1 exodeoxyribonuclease VII small subunit [Bacillota bacterium]
MENGLSFEKAMERMEEIIALLEEGDLDLDKSLEVFEEGIRLYRNLSRRLKEAEGRIKIIMEEQEGEQVQSGIDLEGDNDLDF